MVMAGNIVGKGYGLTAPHEEESVSRLRSLFPDLKYLFREVITVGQHNQFSQQQRGTYPSGRCYGPDGHLDYRPGVQKTE